MPFALILWQPMKLYFDEVTKFLQEKERINVVKFFDFTVKDEFLLEFLYTIYEKDVGFHKNKEDDVFIKKRNSLINKGEIIRIIIVQIENPKFGPKNIICADITHFKHNCRNHFKRYINDCRNIIHACNNEEYSDYVLNFLSKYEDNTYK